MAFEKLDRLPMEELKKLAMDYVQSSSSRSELEGFIRECRESRFHVDEDDDPYPEDFTVAW